MLPYRIAIFPLTESYPSVCVICHQTVAKNTINYAAILEMPARRHFQNSLETNMGEINALIVCVCVLGGGGGRVDNIHMFLLFQTNFLKSVVKVLLLQIKGISRAEHEYLNIPPSAPRKALVSPLEQILHYTYLREYDVLFFINASICRS